MKKTALTICLLLMAVCCVFGLAACDEKQGETVCRHEYADDYTCHDRTCIHCGEVLPASTPHVFGETVTVAPTCTEAGYTTRTCTQCGYEEVTPQGSALGHDFSVLVETVCEADCMEPGEAVYKCSRCDETETRYSDPLGHTPRAGTVQKVAPTCTDDGYTKYTCDRCGKEVTDPESYVDALGHTHAEGDSGVVTAPTCTEGGYTTYTCTRCGQPYRDDETKALGHDFAVLESEETATCAHAAYEVRECTRCGLVEREVNAPKLSHTYDAEGFCTQCNEYVTDVFALSVAKMGDRAAYQYAKTDDKYGYIVYADPNDGGTQYLLNIDKATIDALIAEGYGRITVRLGNPDQNPRTFNWLPDGATANKGGNNFTTEGFNNSCEFTVAISGPTAANITDEYGLDMYVAFNGIGVTVDCFAVDFTFEKGVPSADDSETLVGFRGGNVSYDAEAGTWTFSDMNLSEQDFVNLWVSELLLDTLSGDHAKFTLTAKSGQAVTFGYTNLDGKTISDNGVFGLLIPNSGDLYVQTIYLAGADADGFVLKIEGVDGHVPGIQTGTTAGDCLHGGYPVYICGCGETVTGEEADSIDLTAHSWGADGVCTVCGEAVNEAFILSGYNQKDGTPILIEADETYGYIVHIDTNLVDGKNVAVLNIDEPTIDALMEQGYDVLFVTLGNPDAYARGFSYNVEGDPGWTNYTGVIRIDLNERNLENGLDVCVQYNAGAQAVNTFAYGIAFCHSTGHVSSGTGTVHEATCTEGGYTEYVCDSCGQTYRADETPALGHTPAGEGTVHEATCTEGGYTEYTCSRCGQTYRENETEALGHSFETLDSADTATCEHPAFIRRECTECGIVEYVVSEPQKAHEFGADGVCTICGKAVTEVFAITVTEEGDADSYVYATEDATLGYVVYARTGVWTRINIGRAVIDELLAKGYGRITVRLTKPDANSLAFSWRLDGWTASVAGNNTSLDGFSPSCEFVISLSGPTAAQIGEDGLNIYVAYGGIGGASVDRFGIDLTYEEGIVSAEDPETLVGFRGSNVTYDAATQTYTITGLNVTEQNYFNLWVSELLFGQVSGCKVEFTLSALSGEGITMDYTNLEGTQIGTANQVLVFSLDIPVSGDLFLQTIYFGHFSPETTSAPTGFMLKVAGTAHSWGADGNCTLCGQNVATATVLKGYDNASGAALTVNKLANPGDYQVYAMTNENGAIARLNLDKATVDALIAQGYDTLTVTLGGPNGEYRGFAYNVEGDPSYVGAPIPFTVDLASRNTEGGINIRIQYNFGAAEESMSSFIINLAFSASAAA